MIDGCYQLAWIEPRLTLWQGQQLGNIGPNRAKKKKPWACLVWTSDYRVLFFFFFLAQFAPGGEYNFSLP